MSSDYAIRIELALSGGAKSFGATVLEGRVPKATAPFDGTVTARTVDQALEAWRATGYLRVSARAERWITTGFFGEDAFNELASELAVLMQAAAQCGATGKAVAVVVEDMQGFELSLLKTGLRIKALQEHQAEVVVRKSWVRELIEAAVERTNAELGLPPKPKKQDRPWYRACLQAKACLATFDAERIWQAARDLPSGIVAPPNGGSPHDEYVPLPKAFNAPDPLKTALIEDNRPWTRAAFLPLLARLDPVAAEPLAITILHDPDRDVIQTMAADWALGICGTQSALDELFRLLEQGQSVGGGLIAHPDPTIVERTITLLTPEQIRAYAPGADDPYGQSSNPMAEALIQVLRYRPHPRRLEKLLEIWSVVESYLVALALMATQEPDAYRAVARRAGTRQAHQYAQLAEEARQLLVQEAAGC